MWTRDSPQCGSTRRVGGGRGPCPGRPRRLFRRVHCGFPVRGSVEGGTRPAGARVRAGRPHSRPLHVCGDRHLARDAGDGAAGHRGMAGGEPRLWRPPPQDHGHRGQRCGGHLQGAPTRSRVPSSLPRRPLRSGGRKARFLRTRVLRRPDGRRAVRRQDGDQHVPSHRGRDLRCHRPGHQPEGPHPPCSPAAESAHRSFPPLPVGADHRRGQRDPGGGRHHQDHPDDDRRQLRIPPMRDGTPHVPSPSGPA